jgi:hypothetical protein
MPNSRLKLPLGYKQVNQSYSKNLRFSYRKDICLNEQTSLLIEFLGIFDFKPF